MSVPRTPPSGRGRYGPAGGGGAALSPMCEFLTPEPRVRADSDSAALKGRMARGAKRPAVSPPEDSLETCSPPMSDDDLQTLKDQLVIHDQNFATLNASSKESVARKKDMESIISAYRLAVDKLATAYVRLRAERDTTLRIWHMMRSSGVDDTSGELASGLGTSSLREVVRDEVTKAVEGLREAASGFPIERRSYADVAGDLGRRGDDGMALGGDVARRSDLETLEIVPEKGREADFADAMKTSEAMIRAIKPGEMGIKIDRMVRGRNGTVRIMARGGEVDKIKTIMASCDAGLRVKQMDRMNPRLVIRGVPADIDRSLFVGNLVRQNLDQVDGTDIRVIYWFPANGRGTTGVVVEVPPNVRRRLLQQDRVYIDWSSCSVADHVRVTQCFRCLAVGHIATNCKANGDICGHCAGAHESRACTSRNTLKCHNCLVAKMASVSHSALDIRCCPLLQRKINEKTRQIRY